MNRQCARPAVGDLPWPLGDGVRCLLLLLLLTACFLGTTRAQEPNSGRAVGRGSNGLAAAVAIEQALVESVAAAEKSVVAIARVRIEPPPENGARRIPATPPTLAGRVLLPTDPAFVPNEYGAGVVVDSKGLILTTNHILGNPQKSKFYVWVNRRPFPATILANDPWYDLAVLKIEARGLIPITFGRGGQVRKGQIVLALGNPQAIARDGEASVSWGVISNVLRRPSPPPAEFRTDDRRDTIHNYGTLIQTDAKLNFGFSGGALINLQGQMVGLTTSFAAGVGFDTAAGLAIPVDDNFRRVVSALSQGRRPDFGFLGVAPESNKLALRQRGIWGARVVEVYPGTPALDAGVKSGDLIVKIDGELVYDDSDLIRLISAREPESVVTLSIVPENLVNRVLSDGLSRASQIDVELSKKHVAASLPQIGAYVLPMWRGMRVDFSTAVADYREILDRVDPKGCVVVQQVTGDSAAWQAGLRVGDLISHVADQQVKTPAEFLAAAARDGEIDLRVITGRGQTEVRTVSEGTDEN